MICDSCVSINRPEPREARWLWLTKSLHWEALCVRCAIFWHNNALEDAELTPVRVVELAPDVVRFAPDMPSQRIDE